MRKLAALAVALIMTITGTASAHPMCITKRTCWYDIVWVDGDYIIVVQCEDDTICFPHQHPTI